MERQLVLRSLNFDFVSSFVLRTHFLGSLLVELVEFFWVEFPIGLLVGLKGALFHFLLVLFDKTAL